MTTEHEPQPREGDFFALESTCAACAERILWRIGTGEWEHAR